MKGFTLLEVLLVIAILAIVTSVSIPSYGKFINMNSINTQVNELRKNIRLAQQQAEAGKYNSNHGVHFTTSSYTLYTGENYSSRNQNKDKTYPLNKRMEITKYFDLNFYRDTGKPSATGTIILKNKINKKSTGIKINEHGLVY